MAVKASFRAKNILNENCIFAVLIGLILLVGMYGFVRSPRKISEAENRSLNQFEHFTLRSFIDNSFQSGFENAISDQFVLSEGIRVSYGQAISNLPTYGINNLFCTNRYVDMAVSSEKYQRAIFDCGDYILERPKGLTDSKEKIILQNIENYNKINGMADTYYYYIENFRVFDFEKNQLVADYAEILRENLKGDYKLGVFKINGYDDHKKYFYKTDHHWNYIGSYKGYSEIADMLGIKDKAEPLGVINNHDIFYGSHTSITLDYNVKEEFAFYDFDFAPHDTYVNGKRTAYGHYAEYKEHAYSSKVVDYYHYVYGYDRGEVIFDYHNPGAENLLIIGDSYSDAVKELIASHFNKTYAVDLRYYKTAMNKDFDVKKYIRDNKIDKVLFIMNPPFLHSTELNQGLEN